jgi:hypothetical protein
MCPQYQEFLYKRTSIICTGCDVKNIANKSIVSMSVFDMRVLEILCCIVVSCIDEPVHVTSTTPCPHRWA